jgi:flagellin
MEASDMSLMINHNLMAANAARNLNIHYGALATSVRRLSSGLRVGTAADDAAGLAIRELMRADVATMRQGIRNANDAVSLIQTADGALQVIDEKLIRMKELAEQAATGTYTSAQRLLIDSEYQAMAQEISRIANATDFNGIHLLNGNADSGLHDGSGLESTGKIKIHFGTGNDSAEDYYYIRIGDCTAEGLSLGSESTFLTSIDKFQAHVKNTFEAALKPLLDANAISKDEYTSLMDTSENIASWLKGSGMPSDLDSFRYRYYRIFGGTPDGGGWVGPFWPSSRPVEGYTLPEISGQTDQERYDAYLALSPDDKEKYHYLFAREEAQWEREFHGGTYDNWNDPVQGGVWGGVTFSGPAVQEAARQATVDSYDWYVQRHTYAGKDIRTQENAQLALGQISSAMIEKDKIRAHLGAYQNRLENTISNLQIQAENLLASESRISDVDVATEMTEFTRRQILTQGAAAMLAQANSLPQLALQLMQG